MWSEMGVGWRPLIPMCRSYGPMPTERGHECGPSRIGPMGDAGSRSVRCGISDGPCRWARAILTGLAL